MGESKSQLVHADYTLLFMFNFERLGALKAIVIADGYLLVSEAFDTLVDMSEVSGPSGPDNIGKK